MLPMVRGLQQAWPETKITWVIGQLEHQLLGDIPGIEFIPIAKKPLHRVRRQLAQTLSQSSFDVLLLMQVALRAGWLSKVIKAPVRLGFDRERSRDGHGLFINARISARPQAHVLEGFLDFLTALGIDQHPLIWDIPIPEADQQFAQQHIRDDTPTLIISPCSSQRLRNFRNWPASAYAEVARYAQEQRGLQVILTGGATALEHEYGTQITRQAGVPITNLIGQTSLKQLLALLSRAEALISPDSGPVHMATAVDTPVIGLYATSNPQRTGPYRHRDWVINAYPQALAKATGKRVDQVPWGQRVRDPQAMSIISVADVIQRLNRLGTTT